MSKLNFVGEKVTNFNSLFALVIVLFALVSLVCTFTAGAIAFFHVIGDPWGQTTASFDTLLMIAIGTLVGAYVLWGVADFLAGNPQQMTIMGNRNLRFSRNNDMTITLEINVPCNNPYRPTMTYTMA